MTQSILNPSHELLSTKNNDNVLMFHKDNYFMNTKGELKAKYYHALRKLSKENIIELQWVHGKNGEKSSMEWVVII